MKTDRWTGQWI